MSATRYEIRRGLNKVGTVDIENKKVVGTSKEFRYMAGWVEPSVYEYVPKLGMNMISLGIIADSPAANR